MSPRVRTRRTNRAERADHFFAIYASLGGERTIAKVHQIATGLGIDVGLKTLERYSRDFGWLDRLAAFDAQRQQARMDARLEHAIANDVSHAELGRALQDLARVGVKERTALSIPETEGASPIGTGLSGTEISRLADVGVRIERLASGQATERREIVIGMWNAIIVDVHATIVAAVEGAEQQLRDIGVTPGDIDHVLSTLTGRVARGLDGVVENHLRVTGITLTGEDEDR